MTRRVEIVLNPLRKIAKALRARIDRAPKAADSHLVIVTGINHQKFRVIDQGIPFRGRGVTADAGRRVNVPDAHRDNLPLQLHLHAMKRCRGVVGLLPVERSKARILPQPGDHGIDSRPASRNGPVNAFPSEQ